MQISFGVTAKLISAFVFATGIVQFLFYLNKKFQASSCACTGRFVSDLFGNHIVGFPTRRLICLILTYPANDNNEKAANKRFSQHYYQVMNLRWLICLFPVLGMMSDMLDRRSPMLDRRSPTPPPLSFIPARFVSPYAQGNQPQYIGKMFKLKPVFEMSMEFIHSLLWTCLLCTLHNHVHR